MKRPITAGGEAMPAAPTQEQIAEALLALENQVHELMLMSDIAANAWDNIGRRKRSKATRSTIAAQSGSATASTSCSMTLRPGPAPARQLLCGLTWEIRT